MTNCNKPDPNRLLRQLDEFDKFVAALLTSYNKLVTLTTCNMLIAFVAV